MKIHTSSQVANLVFYRAVRASTLSLIPIRILKAEEHRELARAFVSLLEEVRDAGTGETSERLGLQVIARDDWRCDPDDRGRFFLTREDLEDYLRFDLNPPILIRQTILQRFAPGLVLLVD